MTKENKKIPVREQKHCRSCDDFYFSLSGNSYCDYSDSDHFCHKIIGEHPACEHYIKARIRE